MNRRPSDNVGGGLESASPQPVFSVPTREELTSYQVGILLHIVNSMRGIVTQRVPEEGSVPQKPEYEIAAETTLMKACERLESIVEDVPRWSLSQQGDIHKAMLAAHKKQEQLLQANLELVEMHKRPSIILKPTIATYADQYFIAFWGKLEEPGMHIVGRGRTPAAALADFDAAFHRVPAHQFRIIADFVDRPEPENPAETPEDFKKQNPPENEP